MYRSLNLSNRHIKGKPECVCHHKHKKSKELMVELNGRKVPTEIVQSMIQCLFP